MSTGMTNLPRRVVPRWRDFPTALALGECSSLAAAAIKSLPSSDIETLLDLWRRQKNSSLAGEILSVVLVEGNAAQGRDAARYLLEQSDAGPVAQELSRYLLDDATDMQEALPPKSHNERLRRIRSLRHALRLYPGDSLAWCELSRWHSINGRNQGALRSMLAAVQLSQPNRYIMRSAVRCFLHLGDRDQANSMVQKSTLVRKDPWIAAAAISTSVILGKSPRYYKEAVAMAEDQKFSPFQRSELLAALATLYFENGDGRRALRMIQLALVQPTENVIAQVSWSHLNGELHASLPASYLNFPFAFEANTLQCMQNDDWVGALGASNKWMDDEGFAGRPAVQNAYIRSVAFEDYEAARFVLTHALRTNPGDARILNNLAFCNACLGHTKLARSFLEMGRRNAKGTEMDIVLEATCGLIFFREGRLLEGRLAYQSAMERAAKGHFKTIRAHAAYFLAREERVAKTDVAIAAKSEATKLLKKSGDPAGRLLEKLIAQGPLQLPDELRQCEPGCRTLVNEDPLSGISPLKP